MKVVRSSLFALLLASVAAGCAPKAPVVVEPPAAPRFPEFVFPAVDTPPPGIVLEEHQSAWYLLQRGDARNAERRFSALVKMAPDFHPGFTGLGYVALSRDDHQDALQQFDRALALNGAYAPALAGKGQTYLAMGNRQEALASFDAALKVDPGLTSVRNAADILRVQGLQGGVSAARKAAGEGRLAEARTAYEQAIQASPQSPFLYRELADVERREGNLAAALAHAQKALELDPGEARSYVVLADILEAQGEFVKAADALASAAALEPSDALTGRMEALRTKAAVAALPEEVRGIEQAPTITRAQLAALIGVRLDEIVRRAPRRSTAIINDTRGHWAAPWILAVTRAGFMEVYPNHTFQPGAVVRRGDLALAAYQVLTFVGTQNPSQAARWRNARPRFTDLPAGHLRYPAAAMAVEAGVMSAAGGAFELSRPVTGAEASEAVNRLLDLSGGRRR